MTLDFKETERLVRLFLGWQADDARELLHDELVLMGRSEVEFYAGIVAHGPAFLTSEQWFELLSRIRNKILRSQLDLQKILSSEQLRKLPPSSM